MCKCIHIHSKTASKRASTPSRPITPGPTEHTKQASALSRRPKPPAKGIGNRKYMYIIYIYIYIHITNTYIHTYTLKRCPSQI